MMEEKARFRVELVWIKRKADNFLDGLCRLDQFLEYFNTVFSILSSG